MICNRRQRQMPDPPRVLRYPRTERAAAGLLTLAGLGLSATAFVPGWGHDGRAVFFGLVMFWVGAMWFWYVDQIAEIPPRWWEPPPAEWDPPEWEQFPHGGPRPPSQARWSDRR